MLDEQAVREVCGTSGAPPTLGFLAGLTAPAFRVRGGGPAECARQGVLVRRVRSLEASGPKRKQNDKEQGSGDQVRSACQ